ncbi:MAG: 16S rRNA (uracil(1498)-N(3))-methyltransferase [Desulfopila sp.]
MKRFFFTSAQRSGNRVVLNHSESHHLRRVLRLSTGNRVELYDGTGAVFVAEIVELGNSATVSIVGRQETDAAQKSGVVVGQGVVKNKNMEVVLQKCTELGVDAVIPFVGRYSQGNRVRQYHGKEERRRRIIDEACKQSGRTVPLDLRPICDADEVINGNRYDARALKLLFWEKENTTGLQNYGRELEQSDSVILLFGPEGGFYDEEIDKARQQGWQIVGLGERILRAETAAIASVAIVQHYRGNM